WCERALGAWKPAHRGVEAGAIRFEGGEVRAEELDLHRTRAAGKVVPDVRQDLHELAAHPGQRDARPLPYLVDDLEARALSAALGLEADDVIPPVLQGRE